MSMHSPALTNKKIIIAGRELWWVCLEVLSKKGKKERTHEHGQQYGDFGIEEGMKEVEEGIEGDKW